MFRLSRSIGPNLTRTVFPSRIAPCIRLHTSNTMGDDIPQQKPGNAATDKKPKPEKKEVKILMLHGYTQSGPLFHSKTRALEKLLIKSLSPLNLSPVLIYPTAPNRLRPRDIPGYTPKSPSNTGSGSDDEMDAWAWYRKDESSGSYRFLDQGMKKVAECIRENVGEGDRIMGVVGFSQGGSMSGMLAAAMETDRKVPEGNEWAKEVRDANGGKPLEFAVIYSGFYAPQEELKWLYEPAVKTPTLHFIGGLDTVVDESRSRGLIDRCESPVVFTHPGGHHVPVSKEWAMPLAGFIRDRVVGKL